MHYKYPRISNTLSYERVDENSVEVIDHLTDNSFMFGIEVVRFVKKLDGYTHPYRIKSVLNKMERDDIIDFLRKYELIRSSNCINVSFGTKLRTLWIPKKSPWLRLFAFLSNVLLMVSWLPLLVVGITLFSKNIVQMNFDYLWTGYFIGLFCGLFFHELGHAFAGISYGARVFEMGVMVMYCILPGAYVLLDRSTVKRRMQRVQVNAAGVEANFLLCGLFLMLGAIIPHFGGMFLNAAICNAFIGALNLTFIKGLDGTSIVSELLGTDELIDKARSVITDKKERWKLREQGLSGYAVLFSCYLISILQIALPVLLATNILEVISCFV